MATQKQMIPHPMGVLQYLCGVIWVSGDSRVQWSVGFDEKATAYMKTVRRLGSRKQICVLSSQPRTAGPSARDDFGATFFNKAGDLNAVR